MDIIEESDVDLPKFFQGMAKPKLNKFAGEADQYQDWHAQYDIFIHKARVPTRFKMMMLKNALSGRPLKLIERLGYTEQQYQVALAKLDQRYGGGRRMLQIHLDAIMSFPTVKEENLQELEELSNRLCDLVTKLDESGQTQELKGISALYTMVLQKVPNSLLIRYREKKLMEGKDDGLAFFADWLDQQVNIRIELE
jgi:hypothetical protein